MVWLALIVMIVMLSPAASKRLGSNCTVQGQQRQCVRIEQCPTLSRLLQGIREGTAPPNSLSTLHAARCSFLEDEPLLCCPDDITSSASPPAPHVPLPPITPAPPPHEASTFAPPPLQPPGSSSLECGIRGNVDKLVDGGAPLGSWPWMVALAGRADDGSSHWYCGGVLVSDRYVLTTAHCVSETQGMTLRFVRLGEHNLSFNPDCSKGRCAPDPQDIQVEEVIRHPEYRWPCSECNDIALLRLSRPGNLSPGFVVPICLPRDPVRELGFSEEQFLGKVAWAAGWGSTSRDTTSFSQPGVLQQVQLPIQELPFCDILRRGYPDPRMTLCAGGEGQDTCKRDSGGPLILTNQFTTKTYLVGLTSLGPAICGANGTQGLYTNVVYYMTWIEQTIGS